MMISILNFGDRLALQVALLPPGIWSWKQALGKKDVSVNQDFEELLKCLNRARARYLVVGAYAVIYYTEPRYTKDIDIWIDATPTNAEKVYQALDTFGAPLVKVTVKDFTKTGMVYQIGIEPNRIDIIMKVEGLRFANAWEKRKRTKYGKAGMNLIGRQDLIKNKRKLARPQDLIDVDKLKM